MFDVFPYGLLVLGICKLHEVRGSALAVSLRHACAHDYTDL